MLPYSAGHRLALSTSGLWTLSAERTCGHRPGADLWTPSAERDRPCDDGPVAAAERFLTLTDVGEVLNITPAQTYALVRRGDLIALKIGGRGAWRVERKELEAYIQRMYEETARFIAREPVEDDSA